MDAISWVVIVALGACLLMHLFGHGHGHGRRNENEGATRTRGEVGGDDEGERVHSSHAVSSEPRHRRRGCH